MMEMSLCDAEYYAYNALKASGHHRLGYQAKGQARG